MFKADSLSSTLIISCAHSSAFKIEHQRARYCSYPYAISCDDTRVLKVSFVYKLLILFKFFVCICECTCRQMHMHGFMCLQVYIESGAHPQILLLRNLPCCFLRQCFLKRLGAYLLGQLAQLRMELRSLCLPGPEL